MHYAFVDLSGSILVDAEHVSATALLGLGLADSELADLAPRGYPGIGLWPVAAAPLPVIDPLTHSLGPELVTVDQLGRQVIVSRPAIERPIQDIRTELRARAEARRWQVETGGIVVGGAAVRTDRESQAMITGAAAAVAAGVSPIDWKAANGWVQLTGSQVTALAAAVAAHVQGCFSREREICEAIDAASTVAELLAIDLSAGWPA